MTEEIAFENGWISNFEGLVTLTLTLDRVILHTIVHHSSTSTYTTNIIEIEVTFCGQTDGRTHICMHGRTSETGFIRSTLLKSRLNENATVWRQTSFFQWRLPTQSRLISHLAQVMPIPAKWQFNVPLPGQSDMVGTKAGLACLKPNPDGSVVYPHLDWSTSGCWHH